MSDIYKNTPVERFDKNNPEGLRTHQAEKVHTRHRKEAKWLKHNKKDISSDQLLYAAVMEFLEENAENPDRIDLSHLLPGERELYNLLSAFSSLLNCMQANDKKKDLDYLKHLTETWNYLILAHNRRQHLKPPCHYFETFDNLMHTIGSFGESDGEPLGFYLKGHKNEDWYPIPYLEMLTSLHNEHKINRTDSNLSLWCDFIRLLQQEIISSK